jgi:trehalose synthase-fused probable maltokinase
VSTAEPATIRVKGTLRSALDPESLELLSGQPLVTYLLSRRWFGGKGGSPSDARIVELAPLPWDDGRMAIAIVEVSLEGGVTHRYQLPLAVLANEPPGAPIAKIEASDGTGFLYDAVEDPAFRDRLGRMFEGERDERGDSESRLQAEIIGEPTMLREARARLGSAEQSNTSIIYGDVAILKLFRRLETGENPDVEIGRFFTTQTSFRNTPAMLGTLSLSGADASVVGILQRLVPSAGDAWEYTLEQVERFIRLDDPEPHNAYTDDAVQLGRVTRELHEALASRPESAGFEVRPASDEDLERWGDNARSSIEEGFALLERMLPRLDGEGAGAARVLLRRRAEFPALVEELEEEVSGDAGVLARHHGDYHLGQVLRGADGEFMIIDFEGEPARSLRERREPNSPLRDVAGMLRSLSYAAAVAGSRLTTQVARATVEVRMGQWQRDARRAFLSGYMEHAPEGGHGILPEARESVARLITLFEIEKVFYELRYELNNRPSWVWVPLRGIARLTEMEFEEDE